MGTVTHVNLSYTFPPSSSAHDYSQKSNFGDIISYEGHVSTFCQLDIAKKQFRRCQKILPGNCNYFDEIESKENVTVSGLRDLIGR